MPPESADEAFAPIVGKLHYVQAPPVFDLCEASRGQMAVLHHVDEMPQSLLRAGDQAAGRETGRIAQWQTMEPDSFHLIVVGTAIMGRSHDINPVAGPSQATGQVVRVGADASPPGFGRILGSGRGAGERRRASTVPF